MKLYNRTLILAGIAVFLIVATFPFWWRAAGPPAPPPDLKLDTATITALKERLCVEPGDWMRAHHMKLLADWREGVVREGKRTYRASNGRLYEASLTQTCLKCHSNKAQFCDRCHDYASVKPKCWDCHIISEEVR